MPKASLIVECGGDCRPGVGAVCGDQGGNGRRVIRVNEQASLADAHRTIGRPGYLGALILSPGLRSLGLGRQYPKHDRHEEQRRNVAQEIGAFGVDPGKAVRSEFGGYVKVSFKKELLKNIRITTNLDLFSNYLFEPQNIDVNWDMLLTFKVVDPVA